jgi:hypothetical protein
MVESSFTPRFERVDLSETERLSDGDLEAVLQELGFIKSSEIVDQSGETILYKRTVTLPDGIMGDLPDDFNLLAFKFKGGLARASLAGVLGSDNVSVRDIDACVVADDYIDRPNDMWEISRDYTSHDNYFRTRDFTMNEVLLEPEIDGTFTLTASLEAIIDYLNGVICPTVFEQQDPLLSSRIIARSIRFAAEQMHSGRNVKLAIPPAVEDELGVFDIALQLIRALESGSENEYLLLLHNLRYVPDDIYDMADLCSFLERELEYDGSDLIFDLRTASSVLAKGEPVDARNLFKKFNRLARDKRLSAEDFEIMQ